MAYSWKNNSGLTLKVISAYQCSDSAKHWRQSSEAKMNILSWSPIPLSNIIKCWPLTVSWYCSRSSGISSQVAGFGGVSKFSRAFLIFLRNVETKGKLVAVPSNIFLSSVPKIYWGVSSVVAAFLLILDLTFVTSTSVWEGACVCSFTCSTNLSVGDNLIVALHWLTRKIPPPGQSPPIKFFLN